MTRRLTVYGVTALASFMNYLVRKDGPWEHPEDIVGLYQRRSYGNYKALARFAEELDRSGARHVVLEDGTTIPFSRMRFREPGEQPDLPAQEGVFGFGKAAIGLYGVRLRMSGPGVLEIVDAWGDSLMFGTSAEAKFDEVKWTPDEWDLPHPPVARAHADRSEL